MKNIIIYSLFCIVAQFATRYLSDTYLSGYITGVALTVGFVTYLYFKKD